MFAPELNLLFTIASSSITFFLGAIVAFHGSRSVTSRIFMTHAFVGGIWAAVNYFSLAAPPGEAIFWIRGVIFLAVPHVFLFFLFVWNFPHDHLNVSSGLFAIVLAIMGVMMGLAASPWVFSSVEAVSGNAVPMPGPLIFVFSPTLVLFFMATLALLVRKYRQADATTQGQWRGIGVGFGAAYTLLLFFVFLRVIVWNDTTFVPYSPLFILPMFAGSAYAVLRHGLFNIKVIAAETLTFLLLLASLAQTYMADSFLERVAAVAVTLLTLVFGALLVKSVLREVKEREELQILYQKVGELSRFKTQLLSLASHQIKSPLAAIKGFASLMEEGIYDTPTPKQRGALGSIHKAADDLIELVNTLLDLRKVEEGKMDYQFEKTDLVGLVQEVVNGLEPLARAKHIQFGFIPTLKTVFVNADPVKLTQVIRNLIDNSIKYTPSGFVKVDLRALGGDVVLSVSDSGVGISPELIPHLFEEFVRDEKVKKKILGTGLGLYIARKIVEGHGGKLWAESEGDNKGSTFHVSLPVLP